MKCQYCLTETGRCPENCPDTVAAGPARDRAMVDWGAGRFVALMGEVVPRHKKDDPYFVCGYNTGAVARDEDAERVLEDDSYQPTDFDDPDWGHSS